MTTTVNDYISRVISRMPPATPRRDQIELELRGHIAERMERGQSIDDVVRQLGDPNALAESYLSAVPLVSASFLRRAAAKVIDVVAVFAMVYGPIAFAGMALQLNGGEFFAVAGLGLILAAFVWPFSTMALEYWFGATFGKWMLGLVVVRESGARITFGQSVVRQIPTFIEIWAIDVLFALFTDKHQRAFEIVSKTRVVRV